MWLNNNPIWAMNYSGRVLGDKFNNSFLKEVLSQVSEDLPYREPTIFTKGDYHSILLRSMT